MIHYILAKEMIKDRFREAEKVRLIEKVNRTPKDRTWVHLTKLTCRLRLLKYPKVQCYPCV